MRDHGDHAIARVAPGLPGAVVVLHGEFESAPAHDVATLLRSLGAHVRDELAADVTLLVLGARTLALGALLGPSASERRARALIDAGQRLSIATESDLTAWVRDACGAPSLPEAIARISRGELARPEATAPDATDHALDALLETLRAGTPAARVSAAEALGARGDRRAASALLDATRDAPHGLWVAATRALSRVGGEIALAHARDALADPRSADRELRRALVHALEARGDGAALGALGDVLATVRGAYGVDEAAAFGRMVSRGVRRWDQVADPPAAVEWEEPTPDDALAAQARRAGTLETLRDAQGVHVVRVLARGSVAPTGPFFDLVQRAARRRGGRVWLAGCSLPASLPTTHWQALLGPASGR